MLPALRNSAIHNHGIASYDFDQTLLANYAALVAPMGGVAARPGLCTALSIVWLDGQRNHQMRALPHYVEHDPVGSAFVTTVTNRIAAAAAWIPQTDWEMQQLNFAVVNHAPFSQVEFQRAFSNTQFGIFVASNGANSHAMGIHRMNRAVNFFDPNEGEVVFRNFYDFMSWFDDFRRDVLVPAFARFFGCHILRYT